MAQFKGIRKLSQKKYNELRAAGKLDPTVLYVTPSVSFTVTNITDTITTDSFSGVVNLSEEQYQELITNGSITVI